MKITAGDLAKRLETRFHEDKGWMCFREVHARGDRGQDRYADVVAVGLYPSTNYAVHGFEIKVSRSDWLRELEDWTKCEPAKKRCHHWWLVAGSKDIVVEGELPEDWGLMIPRGKGLVTKKYAPKLDAKPVSGAFLSSLIRTALHHRESGGTWAEKIKQAYADGENSGKMLANYDHRELERDKGILDRFIKETGLDLRSADFQYLGLEKINQAVKLIMKLGGTHMAINFVKNLIPPLKHQADSFSQIVTETEEILRGID